MPAPAEPRPDTDPTAVPSAAGDIDQTRTAALSAAHPAVAFGPPVQTGEAGTLGPYRIVKELGKGGMGSVYAAVDTRLDRKLALKMMLPAFAADRDAKERFLREAKAAAKVNHDNVVTVYEADERGGVPYIAMQFLEGLPLDEYLKKKGSPAVPQIVRIATEAAAGLAAAHKLGLVHRDIKPANLWLEAPNGRVKVLDFGLAKPLDAESEVTKSGAVVGTPAYMSPEQARGEKVDARTDLFSLGAVLYRLCTGKLPFNGPTTMSILMALGMEEPPPVRDLNPAVPESLAGLVHQLLAKRADARPQSAAEVVQRLLAIRQELAAPRPAAADPSAPQSQVMRPQVVYAATPVTVVAAANPFADLDAPEPDDEPTELAPAAGPKPPAPPARAKPGPRWLWPAVGLAVVAAAVAVGVIVATQKKDDRKHEAPDDAAVKDKGGKGGAAAGSGPKAGGKGGTAKKSADPDPHDQVATARWLLQNKKTGGLGIEYNGTFVVVTEAQLPDGPFRVLRAGFHPANNGGNLDPDDVSRLAAFTDLEYLILSRQPTTGPMTVAGAEAIGALKNLQDLDLTYTNLDPASARALVRGVRQLPKLEVLQGPADDDWLRELAGASQLRAMRFYGAHPSDEAMGWFKSYPNLACLRFEHAAGTEAGFLKLVEVKSLRLLEVYEPVATREFLGRLAGLMPECEVRLFTSDHKAVATFNPGKADHDRKAAEWVLSIGGGVQISIGDRTEGVAKLPKERFALTRVNLKNNSMVTDAGFAAFEGCTNLTGLMLDGAPVGDSGLAYFKDCKRLTELGLYGAPVTDAGIAHFKGCKELRYLNLWDARVTDTGIAVFKECKHLTFFAVSGRSVTDAGLVHLKDCKDLSVLLLDTTGVTDAGLSYFAECKNLQRIGLSSTGVTDAGLKHFAECKSLTELDLDSTGVTDTGLKHFTGCKDLTSIRVRNTKVTAKGLADFHAALPGCRIEHDGGAIEPKK